MTESSPVTQRIELAVSDRYAQAHTWVLTAITGFLSAYYMEDARFRFRQRYRDQDGGLYVWLCEIEAGMSFPRLIRRLQADLPPGRVLDRASGSTSSAQCPRYVIDLPEPPPGA
ncbi:hypothetical protein [Nitrospira sp. Kam-Ns4a]